jgi:inhibitor of cysteine peptidase
MELVMVELTEADNGKIIELSRGERLSLRLGENPTTGYRWALSKNDPEILASSGDQYTQAGDGGIGGGGHRAFTFEARKEGRASLEFKHWREWEGERSVTQRFALTVQVR